MRRDRVAVVGERSLFEATVVEALASKSHLQVRRFSAEREGGVEREMDAFQPDMVLVVGRVGQPVLQALLSQMEKGVAIVTLDPTEPIMDFSCRVTNVPATFDSVLDTVRAARALLRGKRTLEAALRG